MAIRIRKRLYLKPRICPECGKFAVIAENYASIRCQKCHQHHRHVMKREAKRRKFGHRSGKYTTSYRAAKKKLIEKHPYCALCGADERLTAHHIGGGAIMRSSPFFATTATRLTSDGIKGGGLSDAYTC